MLTDAEDGVPGPEDPSTESLIPTKSLGCCAEISKRNLKLTSKHKGPRTDKTALNAYKAGGLTPPGFRTHCSSVGVVGWWGAGLRTDTDQ